MIPMQDDPICRIEWRSAAALDSNDYNPNMVFTPELRLLEYSILKNGWVQPVLINRDGIIIDGFHRCRLAQESREIAERYDGAVPCAVLDIPRHEAMMLTVRINRAKGSHAAVRMSRIVRELIDDHGISPEQIAVEIGATSKEVDLLYQEDVFSAKKIKDYRYSKAWYPEETTRSKKPKKRKG